MQPEQSVFIDDKTVKRWLNYMDKHPVDIYPGYWCRGNASVSFMVFRQNSDNPMFEISLGTRGRIVYKNNQKFMNPPLFDELFDKTRQIHTKMIEKIQENNPKSSDIRIARVQNIILDYLAKHNLLNR